MPGGKREFRHPEGWNGGVRKMAKVSVRKRITLALLLAAAALLLCACSGGGGTPDIVTAVPTQNAALVVTEVPSQPDDYMSGLPEGYDPASEENGAEYVGGDYDEMGRSVYAGATPIPLDPVDKPTASPRPELTFNYKEYASAALGLKFEIPYDWTVDDSVSGTLVFTDPNTLDNVNATMTIIVSTVASTYKAENIKEDLKAELSALGQYNYTSWSSTSLEKRTLLSGDGYYANYRGVLYDGTLVRGRVHMAIINGNRRIEVIMNCPGWFNSSYTNVFTHFRNTLAYAE